MTSLKRFVSYVCVWLGGNAPGEPHMPADHSWLVPGPSFLNSLIAWANPQPQVVPATRPGPRP
jgi:hypothetical protein